MLDLAQFAALLQCCRIEKIVSKYFSESDPHFLEEDLAEFGDTSKILQKAAAAQTPSELASLLDHIRFCTYAMMQHKYYPAYASSPSVS